MSWQENLINKLAMKEKIVYMVYDPFGLCFEPAIAKKIAESGVFFGDVNDSISLRLIFEEWADSFVHNALLIRISDKNQYIPFDIMRTAIKVDFHIDKFIPCLDSDVLGLIDSQHYQYLMDVTSAYRVGKLNYLDSMDFILRHIYKIAPEIIQTDVDLIRLLIRKHYLGIEMPQAIERRLISILSMQAKFKEWDFTRLIPNRAEFFTFLQRQWAFYLETQVFDNEIRRSLQSDEHLIVPFDDHDIRVFVDNLFADGILKAIEFEGLSETHWARVGVIGDNQCSDFLRFEHLLTKLEKIFSNPDGNLFNEGFWGEVSQESGVLNANSYLLMDKLCDANKERLIQVNNNINKYFETWLLNSFGRLISTPSINNPNMVHKIPAWLAQKIHQGEKVCLLVMDGMGFQQWTRIKSCLAELNNIRFEESFSFAWVPTITSISRQALFSGKRPQLFSESLLTTDKEAALWRSFWDDQGLMQNEITFEKKVEKNATLESFTDLFHSPSLKAIGFVINFIDEQMHGMKAGMSGLNAVLDNWLKTWGFSLKINALIDFGFTVVVTSDHGNQEAVGEGWKNEGVKAETKGERVRLYRQPVNYSSDNENVLEWPAKKFGLPSDIYPLVSKGHHAFIQSGKKVVGHGGISLHELVVPFVTITRRNDAKESEF